MQLEEKDLTERFSRGSGPGGQHRNKTDSCVTLIHEPSKKKIRIDGRSQWKNRQTARKSLATMVNSEQVIKERGFQDRSTKNFTHNTQRNELVDHSSGNKYNLSKWMKGKI